MIAAELESEIVKLSVSYKLGEVEPRERAGAQTARKYEYQYERTARATLNLLGSHQRHFCVYCDWHDDYVVELESATASYEFHQVKGRKLSQGPWSFREFFGVTLPQAPKPAKATPRTVAAPKVQKPPVVATDAIFARMVQHRRNFGEACSALAFITNAGAEPSLSGFLNSVKVVNVRATMVGESKVLFDRLAEAYLAAKLVDSVDDLFLWLRELRLFTDQGHLESSDAALLELADVIVAFSEIDLLQRQSKQIAREVVSQVRRKVAHTTTVVPATEDTLRRRCAEALAFLESARLVAISEDEKRFVSLTDTGRAHLVRSLRDTTDLGLLMRRLATALDRGTAREGRDVDQA